VSGISSPSVTTPGTACEPSWYDLDGAAADGCEARSDYAAGTVLTQGAALHANLVPASARDDFLTHVSGNALNLCWGSFHVTLTAPARTAEQLTIWKGTSKVADAVSANGAPATATVHKPLFHWNRPMAAIWRKVPRQYAARKVAKGSKSLGGWRRAWFPT